MMHARSANITGVVAAILLFGYAIFTASPQELAYTTHQLGSAMVGISAAVEPNPYNMLASEFAAKEDELRAREAAIQAFERGSGTQQSTDILALASFGMSIILALMVGANFYMDWRRGRPVGRSVSPFAVDLRHRG